MQKVYMADDGVLFYTEEECLLYENAKGIYAFDSAGRLSPMKAYYADVIWFENQEAFDWFFSRYDVEEFNVSIDGLEEAEEYDWGTMFVRSDYEEHFFPVRGDITETFRKIWGK